MCALRQTLISYVCISLTACLVVSTVGPRLAQAQYEITQIIDAAGDGAGCRLSTPKGIAVDAARAAYVAGANSNNAFRITPAGVITEIIDSTGDGAGHTLDAPQCIAADAAGNAYVTGFWTDNAFKITPAGVITLIIGSSGDGAGHWLTVATAIAVDDGGNVYVAGHWSDNVFKITPDGVITEIIDATGDGAGNILLSPDGIAVDAAGNVYVTGFNSDNAFKIMPSGDITEIIDATGDGAGHVLDLPEGIAVDAAGNVYVTGILSDNAFKITPRGAITEIIDMAGDGAGHALDGPRSIAADGAANVYVTGTYSDNLFKVTPAGDITQIIDSTGDGAGHVLDGPIGIAVDDANSVYVCCATSNNAFKLTPSCDALACPAGTEPLVDADGEFAGWCVASSDPTHTDIYVDNVAPGSHAQIEISTDFVARAPITLTFQQVCADDTAAVPMILIADESITNLTGVDWPDFAWQLTGDHDWFDVPASAQFAVFPPFATKTWDDFLDPPTNQRARALRATDGVVEPFDSFFPGHGTGSLKIVADLSASDAPLFFELVETSSAIHVLRQGDFDADGDVDLADFATFVQCFGASGRAAPPACTACDLDGDTDVDLADFAAFSQLSTGSR